MAKNNRTKLTDLIDQDLILTGGLTSAEDAQQFNIDNKLDLEPSFVTLIWAQRQAKFYSVSPTQFLEDYIDHKFESFDSGDKGARGDAIEALVRYYIKRRFITYNDVMTAEQKKADIHARFGRIEVGHNGKTFQSAYVPSKTQDKATFTEKNYMNGNYSIVIYGVFNKSFTKKSLLNEKKFLSTMRVFVNKYEFPHAIAGKHGLASGWNVSGEKATVQFTPALMARFEEYCEAHNVPTLAEFLND